MFGIVWIDDRHSSILKVIDNMRPVLMTKVEHCC